MPVEDHPVLELAAEKRAAIIARDADVLNDITRSYARAVQRLQSDVEHLIAVAAEGGESLTAGQLAHLAATRNMIEGIKAEMDQFASVLADKIDEATLAEINAAGLDTLQMAHASLPALELAEINGIWTRVVPDQVYQAYGMFGPEGAIHDMLVARFGDDVANHAKNTLLTGFIAGKNPRQIASHLNTATGHGLDWAMTTARTANLWAYRSASQLNYLRNAAVVKGWIWYAQLDDRVCLSCIAQHGSFHPNSEILADHHRGRCTPLPVTRTYAELGFDVGDAFNPLAVQSGEEWFNTLDPGVQRQMLGPSKYKAWKDGAFDFGQLSGVRSDQIYGPMRVEESLKGMVGAEKAAQYYGG